MILYSSITIRFLDSLGRKQEKTIPFDSNARKVLADMYNNSRIIVTDVFGCDPIERE